MACTCACEGCDNARSDCHCPGGPTGEAAGSCPIHSFERSTDDHTERGALDQYRPLGVRSPTHIRL
jgi:hypothetical protein